MRQIDQEHLTHLSRKVHVCNHNPLGTCLMCTTVWSVMDPEWLTLTPMCDQTTINPAQKIQQTMHAKKCDRKMTLRNTVDNHLCTLKELGSKMADRAQSPLTRYRTLLWKSLEQKWRPSAIGTNVLPNSRFSSAQKHVTTYIKTCILNLFHRKTFFNTLDSPAVTQFLKALNKRKRNGSISFHYLAASPVRQLSFCISHLPSWCHEMMSWHIYLRSAMDESWIGPKRKYIADGIINKHWEVFYHY